MAGVDQMGGCSNPQYLIDGYEFGCAKVGKERMNAAFADAARRLLKGYFLTGLFEDPYVDVKAALADVNNAEKQVAAAAAHRKAI